MRPLQKIFDQDALRSNYLAARRRSHARNLMAVVKSRAYGHGLPFAADALADVADGFGVVELKDAQTLRRRGVDKPVFLLSGAFAEEEMAEIASLQLRPAVCDERQAQWVMNAPSSSNLFVLVKTNADMNRLGFSPQQAAQTIDALSAAPSVSEVALMTHFACADHPDGLQQPLELLQPLRKKVKQCSLGNSAATLLHGDIEDDWGRAGIALYGSSPAPQWQSRDELGLRAVMTLQTELIHTRVIAKDAPVGYGGEWRAPQEMTVGIAACGYGDGLPRVHNLPATVGGKPARTVGRVSMELIALDLRECPEARAGDQVILWGESPGIDEVAEAAGRISYELLTAAG